MTSNRPSGSRSGGPRRGMRRLTTVIAGIAVVGVILSTTAGPAAAAVLTSLAERESWTLEERVAHGEDLWGKDAVKGDEPLPAYERKALPAGEPPAIVEGAPTTDSGDDSEAPAAPTEPG